MGEGKTQLKTTSRERGGEKKIERTYFRIENAVQGATQRARNGNFLTRTGIKRSDSSGGEATKKKGACWGGGGKIYHQVRDRGKRGNTK